MQLSNSHRNTPQTFWNQVTKEQGCWEWTGNLFNTGRGRFCFLGKDEIAHRLTWKLSKGPIPKEMHILHKCDNPICCKPWHLFFGDHNDNMKDMSLKHRSRSGNLNDEKVLEIRQRYRSGELQREIAVDFNITSAAVSAICSRKSYKYV